MPIAGNAVNNVVGGRGGGIPSATYRLLMALGTTFDPVRGLTTAFVGWGGQNAVFDMVSIPLSNATVVGIGVYVAPNHNTLNANAVITLYNNGVATPFTITIPAGASGTFTAPANLPISSSGSRIALFVDVSGATVGQIVFAAFVDIRVVA